jgi:hypothetical protein
MDFQSSDMFRAPFLHHLHIRNCNVALENFLSLDLEHIVLEYCNLPVTYVTLLSLYLRKDSMLKSLTIVDYTMDKICIRTLTNSMGWLFGDGTSKRSKHPLTVRKFRIVGRDMWIEFDASIDTLPRVQYQRVHA